MLPNSPCVRLIGHLSSAYIRYVGVPSNAAVCAAICEFGGVEAGRRLAVFGGASRSHRDDRIRMACRRIARPSATAARRFCLVATQTGPLHSLADSDCAGLTAAGNARARAYA